MISLAALIVIADFTNAGPAIEKANTSVCGAMAAPVRGPARSPFPRWPVLVVDPLMEEWFSLHVMAYGLYNHMVDITINCKINSFH